MSAQTMTQVQQSAPPALTPVQGVVLQRTCACGQHTIGGGECETCRQKRAARVQRVPRGSDPTGGLPGVTAPPSSTARRGHDFSRVRVRDREAEAAPGLAISQPGDRHEQEAERAAAQVMDMLGAPAAQDTRGLVRLSRAAPSLQRAVAEAIDASATEAAVAPAEAAAEESAAPETAAVPGLLVEDDVTDAGPGQLRQDEFLAQLRAEICAATESILAAVGRTSDGCPYLDSWFGYYGARSARHLERAIRRYAPETASAASARDYIPPIVARIRRAVAVWATTGEITGVPEGVSTEAPGAGAAAGAEGGPASTGAVALKAREGGARGAMDPRAIRARLGPGRALDSGVRTQMETAFGQDFSAVRVHMGARAADLSASLNARAFTLGRDVAFGAGEYQPGTPIGDALIAHELAHVVQQGGVSAAVAPMNVGATGYNALEEDADLAAVGAVAAVWGGATGALKEIARNAKPRLRSGLGLQRCNSSSSPPTPTPAPTPAPPPPPPGPVPSDFQISGLDPSTAANTLFFDRGLSTIDPSQSPKIAPLKTPAARDLTLFGFTSEDENVPPAAGTALVNARIAEVDTALRAAPGGHTGPQRPVPDTTSGVGQIDYRSMRKVVVVPTGLPSGVTSCAAGSVVPCAPASRFTTAQTRAGALLTKAIGDLTALSPATRTLFDARFGTTSVTRAGVVALVKTNLTNLKSHILTQMTPVGAPSTPGPGLPGHICANNCDSGCTGGTVAYNTDQDAAALMTLCDTPGGFMREPDLNERAATLIHEGLHGITLSVAPPAAPSPTVPGSTDFAYGEQRLIKFLDPATALQNTDSYVILVRQLNGHSMSVGRTTPDPATGVAMSAAEREEVDRAIAWLEGWVIWADLETASLYGTIDESIRAGSWTNTYYRATMGMVAPRFGLTTPPALPTANDKFAVAAIQERYARMSGMLYNTTSITINRVSAGSTAWAAGPGPVLTVGPDFFGIPAGPGKRRAQLDLLLQKIVDATPGISAGAKTPYVELVNQIRIHQGGGSP